ncbi:MAG: Nif11-like leader peptide family RiPP precursor [Schwartzia sp.]|nr:Nif11-like leader peptide family RiPP precursor [Schwartzia sp. (in: firmicutes)]
MEKQFNVGELTKEQIEKAMACQTAEELIAAAKEEGFDITREEAEAYMAEIADFELDDEMLSKAAGGGLYDNRRKRVERTIGRGGSGSGFIGGVADTIQGVATVIQDNV